MSSANAVEITPRIGDVEPIVMEAEYQLPWERDANQTACGQTIQRQNGDLDWRIVFRGVVTLSQLDSLRDLRSNSGEVETRTAAFGVKIVTFDELRVTRADEESVGNVDGTVEPLYAFQLQTKELEDDEGLFGE
jgi:hypothetical protein